MDLLDLLALPVRIAPLPAQLGLLDRPERRVQPVQVPPCQVPPDLQAQQERPALRPDLLVLPVRPVQALLW